MGNSQTVPTAPNSQQDPREELAACLARSGMALHGTSWCGWCTRQLQMFGPAGEKVPYVDCTRPNGERGFSDECKAKGIRVVPSWSTKSGDIAIGTQTLNDLAAYSGCGHIAQIMEQFDKAMRQ